MLIDKSVIFISSSSYLRIDFIGFIYRDASNVMKILFADFIQYMAHDETDTAAFDSMMGEGLAQAKVGQGIL